MDAYMKHSLALFTSKSLFRKLSTIDTRFPYTYTHPSAAGR